MPFEKKKCLFLLMPFLSAFLFLFAESSFFQGYGFKMPFVSLIIGFVFYFSVFNPKDLNIFLVFILGFFADFLMIYPLGFHAVCLTLTAFLGGFYRRFISHLSFKGQWGIFTLVFTGVLLVMAMLISLVLNRSISFDDFVYNLMLVLLSYPFMAKLSAFVNLRIKEGK